ncbi:uncharacterized protein LOC125226948 [Leguminivora glycinivorella]|uniref:uncharacterized protein LOC125226948 n=1 Tax=Leguminivora glycinivorella TaxID=1035111 RepID=UPI00200E1120|nr:uncharacterized protein LOC125226948 [Leguminivora glycinivorella]
MWHPQQQVSAHATRFAFMSGQLQLKELSTPFALPIFYANSLEDEVMVSFDVTSLFTNVPVAETIELIRRMANRDDSLTGYMKLIEFCLTSGYFVWRGEYYLQIEGVAMGSPIAPVVANLFMEHFEQRALESCPHKSRLWWRYVDDRKERDLLTHKVYRKATHTDRYLQADSHHHPAHLSSVPRALINRALRLCDPQYVQGELRRPYGRC